ncbi:hypothetical protein QBC39DRAFT_330325 [Podospora conica]|nr:hypothetical protein QBC39DRAFT_330325 [Schizothecium conicum]
MADSKAPPPAAYVRRATRADLPAIMNLCEMQNINTTLTRALPAWSRTLNKRLRIHLFESRYGGQAGGHIRRIENHSLGQSLATMRQRTKENINENAPFLAGIFNLGMINPRDDPYIRDEILTIEESIKTYEFSPCYARVLELVVHPDYRRRGYGELLVKWFMQEAEAPGLDGQGNGKDE